MGDILALTVEHLMLSAAGVGLALVVGIPLAILITRYRTLAGFTMAVTDVLQTIPSMALLAALMIYLGLGNQTLVVTLMIYSLLPIVRNTYTGITGIDKGLIEAGKGMGMTRWQLLRMVQIPVALPVIMAGIRVAMVTAIGIATLGVLIGGGGLGAPIWRGMQIVDSSMILSGAIPAALIAILCEFGLAKLEKAVTPRGMKASSPAKS
ncbi:MAG: ABC transporter permease [Syntrophomonadaceae bacterium]|nr:ABC transporter permease [Syntrophomonadaceae bacterium]